MTPQPDYKTRKDGTIDYGYYITRSRELRSQGAHHALQELKRVIAIIFRIRPNWSASTGSTIPA